MVTQEHGYRATVRALRFEVAKLREFLADYVADPSRPEHRSNAQRYLQDADRTLTETEEP